MAPMTTKIIKPDRINLLAYLKYLSQQPKGFCYYGHQKKGDGEEVMPPDRASLLKKLYDRYRKCQQCPLATAGRTQVVFGTGNPHARLMFVGEGPGRDEDLQGEPFVGRAGQLLNNIIQAMGLKREEVYISNVVKCRPPNNRTPLPIERNTCKELLLFKEIEIIKPQIICTLGSPATQGLLGDDIKISQVRGRFFTYRDILVMPTYHPAYLLRNPAEKKTVWEDMKKIMEKLNVT